MTINTNTKDFDKIALYAYEAKGWDRKRIMVSRRHDMDAIQISHPEGVLTVSMQALIDFKVPKEGTVRIGPGGLHETFMKGQWHGWDPEIPDAGHPTKEKRENTPVDENQLKRAYHERIILLPKNHVRMVGYAKDLESHDYDAGDSASVNLWFPDRTFNPDGPKFNLVFSLGSDGRHYMIEDIDKEERPSTELGSLVIPSTHHWHRYWSSFLTWEVMLGALESRNPDNAAYLNQVKRTGFNAARPPWVEKTQGDPTPMRYMEDYHDIQPWKYKDEAPKYEGWDALFEDDE